MATKERDVLHKNLKKIFLSYVNEDAYHAYKNILNIDDEFLSNLDDARFNILGPLLYYTRVDYQLFNFRNQFKISKNKKILFFDSSDSSEDRSINFAEKFGLENGKEEKVKYKH